MCIISGRNYSQALLHPSWLARYINVSFSRKKRIATITGVALYEIDSCFNQIKSKAHIYKHVNNNVNKINGSLIVRNAPNPYLEVETIYVLLRTLKPQIVIETGVASGLSSLFILQALHDNNRGYLYSIDLPNADPMAQLPEGAKPGWLIPNNMKSRWNFIEGRSSEKLLPILKTLKYADLFFHDSEHTYHNMMYEFKTMWPYLREKGILISDDFQVNDAFNQFAKEVQRQPIEFFRLAVLKK